MKAPSAILALAFAAVGTFSVDVLAQSSMDHSKMGGMKMEKAANSADMTEGEVRKIDKEQGKITLKHGEIKNLDMPGMTMVFKVKDAAMLDKVKEGDKVGFTAEKIGGAFTVTGIEAKN